MSKLGKQYPDSGKIILRDYLAIDRTRLANQRTLLSFLRTGLYLLVTAFAIMRVDMLRDLIPWAWVGIVLAITVSSVGIVNYLLVRRRVKSAYRIKEE